MKFCTNSLSVIVAVGALVLCSDGQAQGNFQWTVTFDFGPPVGDEVATSFYSERGMAFRPIGIGQFGHSGGGIPQRADNGTAFLVGAFTYSLSVTGSPVRFGLVSVDLAEYSTVVPDAVTVRFVGYRHDGSIVTTNITTDGIFDGAGPLPDFQTFYFDTGFSDVVRVEVPTYGWSLDNIVFSNVVPEPRVTGLAIVGISLIGIESFRRKVRSPRNNIAKILWLPRH